MGAGEGGGGLFAEENSVPEVGRDIVDEVSACSGCGVCVAGVNQSV